MAHFTANGHRLFYRERGSGPLLLLLHGNTASSACHAGEIDYFSNRYRVVAMDAFGVGQSERGDVWPHHWWLQTAHDAASLIAHFAEGPAIVMGPSGGGVAALLMAIHHPECVRAVVADSCVETWTPEEVTRLVADRSRLSLGQIAFWQHAHGDDWHAVVQSDTAMILSWQQTGISFYDGRVSEIRCPVLLSDSLADELLPRTAEQVSLMAQAIPNCRTLLADSGRHPLMWSRPDEFRRVADLFLANLP
jgi:valacyclovir hydrolase